MKKALVLGAGGFIGSHMVKRLKKEGYWIRGVDLKRPEFSETEADDFRVGDLRNQVFCSLVCAPIGGGNFDLVIQMAADMGGCQFVFTGENDADILHNSATINLNVLDSLRARNFDGIIFYSSSACIYPEHLQLLPENIGLKESDAYPASPDSDYGFEKLFSERLYLAYEKNYGINVRIGRYHNIYGEDGTYLGGREKAPASICRKVAESVLVKKNSVDMWGDGTQTRSFLYIDDCIDATLKLINSDYKEPINIGSEESVSIKKLWQMAIEESGLDIKINETDRPKKVLGVMGRNSNNTIILKELNWKPKYSLKEGIKKTYSWIYGRIACNK